MSDQVTREVMVAFFNELEKIANYRQKITKLASKKEEKKTTYKDDLKLVGGGLGANVGSLGLYAGTNDIVNPELEKKLIESNGDLTFTEAPHKVMSMYDPKNKRVYYKPGDTSTLAHEIGHHKTPTLTRLSMPSRVLGGAGVSGAIGALSGLSDNPTVQAAGRWAPMAISVPTLLSEAGASAHALYNMRRHGASGKELLRGGAGQLLPALGSYAGSGVLNTGLSHLAQRGVLNLRDKEAQLVSSNDEVLKEAVSKEWIAKHTARGVAQRLGHNENMIHNIGEHAAMRARRFVGENSAESKKKLMNTVKGEVASLLPNKNLDKPAKLVEKSKGLSGLQKGLMGAGAIGAGAGTAYGLDKYRNREKPQQVPA